ncbi:MAG TPA: methionyl-tRNA formyltransferase [Candidatus Nitrosotalea sp.]|nr:methionyl-tRNA formyltransferase [Candidatus Nitrosotalea sp.]
MADRARSVVFAGSAEFAVPSLRALNAAGYRLGLVVTQPDRPGHRLRLSAPPVKVEALGLGLSVFQPERIGSPESLRRIAAAAPDLMVVVAYGQIIPPALLSLPAQGVINVHASLLPRHRGAAPIAAAILAGDKASGVSIMLMDEKLDHGPVLQILSTPIEPEEDSVQLGQRLSHLGAGLLVDTLDRIDELIPEPQDERQVTLAPKLQRSDGELDWGIEASRLERAVRALQPWPGVTVPWSSRRLKVLRGRACPGLGGRPGEVLERSGDGVLVACAVDSYRLELVQMPGGRPGPARLLLAADA